MLDGRRTEVVYPPRDEAVEGSQRIRKSPSVRIRFVRSWCEVEPTSHQLRKSPSDRIRFAYPTPFRLRTETKSVLKRSWGFGLGWVFADAKWIRNCEVEPTSQRLRKILCSQTSWNFQNLSKNFKISKFQKIHQIPTNFGPRSPGRRKCELVRESDFAPTSGRTFATLFRSRSEVGTKHCCTALEFNMVIQVLLELFAARI